MAAPRLRVLEIGFGTRPADCTGDEVFAFVNIEVAGGRIATGRAADVIEARRSPEATQHMFLRCLPDLAAKYACFKSWGTAYEHHVRAMCTERPTRFHFRACDLIDRAVLDAVLLACNASFLAGMRANIAATPVSFDGDSSREPLELQDCRALIGVREKLFSSPIPRQDHFANSAGIEQLQPVAAALQSESTPVRLPRGPAIRRQEPRANGREIISPNETKLFGLYEVLSDRRGTAIQINERIAHMMGSARPTADALHVRQTLAQLFLKWEQRACPSRTDMDWRRRQELRAMRSNVGVPPAYLFAPGFATDGMAFPSKLTWL
ncbi:hypothetical protein N5C66_26325 [Rhizobium pusense]|uniref:hypothetical protein n=1 Tax=Agrobacterium pusense TaxID=648995 RepID=UPI000D1B8E41|nr:hypothetical protein [Agrobacterium pusense]MDH0912541.1 hypothetical protein [Agrobacterium pusense]MDH1098612.1 hypothetical protein [Agrobacterium pusense]MDH1115229.1 hypothetical protein [Agrobacterium pusense]MDH2197040.1 hypothetical protein [Agrobacterium pusense]